MNVNSGGPHLLLFERDQQLTALLTSEFQLAGYECHAARTAVEVFDAIARYPIRLVLVNLAQAAAGRREFWVALDAQRRGRGVQVLTFRCMNLAGYGPDDPDDRARTVLADMEVDGMLGVMNMVDAVRARIPGSTTGSSGRIPATPVPSRQPGAREAASAGVINRAPTSQAVPPAASITGQATSPLPMMASNGTSTVSASSAQQVTSPTLQRPQQSMSGVSVPQTGLPISSMPAPPTVAPATSSSSPGPSAPPLPGGTGNAPSSFTEKLRAVIYPSSRNFSQIPAAQETGGNQMNAQNLASQPSTDESGLEQLSRMVREHASPAQEGTQKEQRHQQNAAAPFAGTLSDGQLTQHPIDSPPISAMSLRPSPIQDIAIEPGAGSLVSGGSSTQIVSQEAEPAVSALGPMSGASAAPINSSASPDASPQTHLAAFMSPSTPALPPTSVAAPASLSMPVSMQDSSAMPKSAQVPAPGSRQAPISMSAPAPTPIKPENEEVVEIPRTDTQKDRSSSSFTEGRPGNGIATMGHSGESYKPEHASNPSQEAPNYRSGESPTGQPLVGTPLADALKANVQDVIRGNETGTSASTDETLLNIVQSFPPMPSPSQQPQPPVLSGRATRSLGSVLLEGHLVPQHRLEVAQHIQRMLRGVDMNYQLGEILLMFKLLTPDQLLAASLVSYGLISTMQISALGRIRQELHSIGLEYDLESLLILFRILSPEQLREVRASWSA